MSFVLDTERLSYVNLMSNQNCLDELWDSRLSSKIPHLDSVVTFYVTTEVFQDTVFDEEDEKKEDMCDAEYMDYLARKTKLSLLCLELVGGVEYIREQLSGPHALAFVATTLIVFRQMREWIVINDIKHDHPESSSHCYLSHFIKTYGFNRAVVQETTMIFPVQKVKEETDVVLSEINVSEELKNCIRPILEVTQAVLEISVFEPTFN